MRALFFTMLFAAATVGADANEAVPVQAVFAGGASSSGWLSFASYTNFGIYVPVTIAGHAGMALVYGGPSGIDKGLAAAIGLVPKTDDANAVVPMEVHVGDVTIRSTAAALTTAQAYAQSVLGAPVICELGEDVFDRLDVEIDFAHHRLAFRDPASVTIPVGATDVPLAERDGERVVPLSIDGAPPAYFELELGNVIGPLLVTPAFAQAHGLFTGHVTSQRLSGRFIETIVSVDHLGFAGLDFPHTPIAIVPESQLPPASITGGVGLPLLSKFHLIVDYPHDRLYAMPDSTAIAAPIPKDRIGMVLSRTANTNGAFSVAFVAPNSPAAAAGFVKGDAIASIDGKPFSAWPMAAILGFPMADPGTTHTFAMADGSVRRVTAADFF